MSRKSDPVTSRETTPAELSHLYVLVEDLQRSRSFYVDLLGLRVLLEEDGYVRVGGGDGFHIGMEKASPGTKLGGDAIEIVIRVDDVDRRYNELCDRGIEFDSEPADQPWGARHVWLRDPDGNRVSLFSL